MPETKTPEEIYFEESNKELPDGIYPGMANDKIYNAMRTYAAQELAKNRIDKTKTWLSNFLDLTKNVPVEDSFAIADFIHALVDQEKRTTTIGFAEWIGQNNYMTTTLSHEVPQLWEVVNYPGPTPHDTNEITSEQLCDLYLQSLNNQ